MQSTARQIRRGNAVITNDGFTVKKVVRRRGSTKEGWRQARRYAEAGFEKINKKNRDV